MGPGAGPPVFLHKLCQARLKRIALDVACHCPKILLVFDDAREKAILPDAAGLLQFTVEVLGVHLVGKADAARQGGLRPGYGEQVDMVVHQAPGPDLNVMLLSVACQQFQIYLPIFIIEENRGAVVAALGDVMRISGGDDTGDSWHGGDDNDGFMRLQEKIWGVSLVFLGSVPSFPLVFQEGRPIGRL